MIKIINSRRLRSRNILNIRQDHLPLWLSIRKQRYIYPRFLLTRIGTQIESEWSPTRPGRDVWWQHQYWLEKSHDPKFSPFLDTRQYRCAEKVSRRSLSILVYKHVIKTKKGKKRAETEIDTCLGSLEKVTSKWVKVTSLLFSLSQEAGQRLLYKAAQSWACTSQVVSPQLTSLTWKQIVS
jgi:hypothetical protein